MIQEGSEKKRDRLMYIHIFGEVFYDKIREYCTQQRVSIDTFLKYAVQKHFAQVCRSMDNTDRKKQ